MCVPTLTVVHHQVGKITFRYNFIQIKGKMSQRIRGKTNNFTLLDMANIHTAHIKQNNYTIRNTTNDMNENELMNSY
jgi:phenylalanyl-tRNA synthetase alpha subunit